MLLLFLAHYGSRFDCRFQQIPQEYFAHYMKFLPVYLALLYRGILVLRLYRSIWRFASYNELLRVTMATGITLIFHIAGMSLIFGRMPVSYYVFGIILQFVFTLAIGSPTGSSSCCGDAGRRRQKNSTPSG